jgi:uncharacterized membrane protein YecN with MAPEG domain
MTSIEAFGLYAALNALIILALSYNVTRNRQRAKVSLGTGEDEGLLRACRAQANAVEYTPIALIVLLALAMMQAPIWAIHVGGGVLTLARALHGYGLNKDSGRTFGRFAGTLFTWLVLLVAPLYAIFLAFT